MDFKHLRLSDIADQAPGFGVDTLEARPARTELGAKDIGLTSYRPDGDVGLEPDAVMEQVGRFVCDELRDRYPKITLEIKRAILFAFHEPMDNEDPTVDLVICLTRRDRPG